MYGAYAMNLRLGNLSLTILLLTVLSAIFSLIIFWQYSVPRGYDIPEAAYRTFGSSIDNPVGLITGHLVHRDISHLIGNLIFSAGIFLFALFLEHHNSRFKTLNVLNWIIAPLLVSSILIILAHAFFRLSIPNFNPLDVGLSVFIFYGFGFMFLAGWKDITDGLQEKHRLIVLAFHDKNWLAVFSNYVFPMFLLVLLVFFAIGLTKGLEIFSFMFLFPKDFAALPKAQILLIVDTFLSWFSHFCGFLVGIFAAKLWLARVSNQTTNKY